MKSLQKRIVLLPVFLVFWGVLCAAGPGPRPHRRTPHPKCVLMLRHALGDQAQCRLYETDGQRFALVERDEERLVALFTADYSRVEGYRGITNCLVLLDVTGTVKEVKVLESEDTPPYVQRVIREGFLDQFAGLKPETRPEVDAVSGATITCDAIRDSVFAAVQAFTRIVEAWDFSGTGPRRRTDGAEPDPVG